MPHKDLEKRRAYQLEYRTHHPRSSDKQLEYTHRWKEKYKNTPLSLNGVWLRSFWERVIPEPNSGCWLWTGSTAHFGHGKLIIQGREYHAHRLSWMIHYGLIEEDICVLHHCDVPCCVNPRHLFLGTRRDNRKDCFSKNRHAKGEQSGMSKLTRQQITEIRNLRAKGNTLVDIGKQFGVVYQNIGSIVRRETWKDL
ncbi:MAG TPA: HNH endonuclease [Thermoguttaceae bacterium]